MTVTGRARLQPGFRGFLGALVGERPGRLAWVIAVQTAAALGQAVCVLLLVPLLGAIGVSPSSGVARWSRGTFLAVGLRPTLVTVLCVYVVVTAVSGGLSAYQTVLATRYRLEFGDHLRSRLYAAVGRAEWLHLMHLRQSDLLAVLTTNVAWVGIAAVGALQIVVVVILVLAQLAAAIRISPALTGLAILAGALLIAVVWPFVRRSRRLGAELVERNRGLLALATGFLDALKLVKAYGREEAHVHAFGDALADARRSQIEFARATGIANAVQLTLTALLLGVTVEVAVRFVIVPAGSLLVVAFVFTRVVSQVTSAQTNIQQLAQGLPSFDEVVSLIVSCEGAPELSPPTRLRAHPVGIGHGVSLNEVHFSYPLRPDDRLEALRGVSLEVPVGAMVALVGPSGAGKTTVADLVAGLILPTAGEVIVAGAPLTAERLLGWRSSVALVPQDPFLFHETIAANLRWARPDATDAEIWDALAMAAAAEFVERLPEQLGSIVGDRGMRLSGGERQRLALARALLREPDLLILDEATSSLDTENERAIRRAMGEIRDHTTMLVIAHRLSTVSDADEIVVLDGGEVVQTGRWEELSRLPAGRMKALIDAGASALA